MRLLQFRPMTPVFGSGFTCLTGVNFWNYEAVTSSSAVERFIGLSVCILGFGFIVEFTNDPRREA